MKERDISASELKWIGLWRSKNISLTQDFSPINVSSKTITVFRVFLVNILKEGKIYSIYSVLRPKYEENVLRCHRNIFNEFNQLLPIASIIAASRQNASTGKEFWKTWIEMTPYPSFQMSNIRLTFLLT
jgi:hypothetical protein